MAIVVAAGTSTPGANAKSADLISGTYQFVKSGKLTLVAKTVAAAQNINMQLLVNGQPLINDLPVPYYAASGGSLSINDNVVASQMVAGGRIEMFARNTGGTAGDKVEYQLLFDPK